MIRAAVAAGLLVLLTGAALAAPVSSSEYARTLDGIAQRLTEAARAGKPGSRLATQALSDLLLRAQVGPVAVDNRELLQDLTEQIESGPKGIARAAEAVRSLEQAVAATAAGPQPDARRALAEVLRHREFTESWWDKLQQRIEAAVGRFLKALFNHAPGAGPPWIWRAVGWGALLAAATLVVYLIVRLTSGFLGPRRRPAPQELAAFEPLRPHREWLAEAEQQHRAGDHRAGVRALYMAALMRLDASGHVGYESSRTDGWFVRALQSRGKPELARALAPLARLFSATWYGRASAGPHEYVSAQQLWQQLETLAS